MHFMAPPVGEGGTATAAREAMKITFFHWGLHAWAIYAVVALTLAFFCYRHGLPLTLRSALYPLIGNRIHGPIGHAVDIFAIIGTVLGVATSLGLGVAQINSGLNHLFGVPVGVTTQIILIIVTCGLATLSVASGLDKGIRIPSEANLVLAAVLLFRAGGRPHRVPVPDLRAEHRRLPVGHRQQDLQPVCLRADRLDRRLDVVLLGLVDRVVAFRGPVHRPHLARPHHPRIRQRRAAGAGRLHAVLDDGVRRHGHPLHPGRRHQGFAETVQGDSSLALFAFLEQLPWSGVVSIVAIAMVAVFFVTSADSGALVVDLLASGGAERTPMLQRIFWSLLMGAVAIALLLADGLTALQTATIASALPFSVILLLSLWGCSRR